MGGASVIEQVRKKRIKRVSECFNVRVKAFLSNEYQTKHSDDDSRSLIERLKQYLADQVMCFDSGTFPYELTRSS
jgi:hypothetical protein